MAIGSRVASRGRSATCRFRPCPFVVRVEGGGAAAARSDRRRDEVRGADLHRLDRVGRDAAGPGRQDLPGVRGDLAGARRDRRRAAPAGGHDDRGSRPRRQDDDDRRAVRGDEGAARRLLRPRLREPRRGDRVRRPHPGGASRRGRGQAAGGAIAAVEKREIARLFREEWGRAVAALVHSLRDVDLAEDAVQEAFVVALRRWPRDGVPANPGAWILVTARNRAIDRLRRERRGSEKLEELARLLPAAEAAGPEGAEEDDVDEIPDERLSLVFMCCHPALALEAQVPLTLRLLGGLTTAEIARAFLVPEPTMAQRLVRAKRKIRLAGIPVRVPPRAPSARAARRRPRRALPRLQRGVLG